MPQEQEENNDNKETKNKINNNNDFNLDLSLALRPLKRKAVSLQEPPPERRRNNTTSFWWNNNNNNNNNDAENSSNSNYAGENSSDTSSNSSSHPVSSPAANLPTPDPSVNEPVSSQDETRHLISHSNGNKKCGALDKESPSSMPRSPSPKEAKVVLGKPPKPNRQMSQHSVLLPQMPCVSTTGNGPNGKTISGFLYKYSKTEVSIVCVCHGTSFSPAKFVEHAGGVDIEHPLKHIRVVPFALG